MEELPKSEQPSTNPEGLERRKVEDIIAWGNRAVRGEFSGDLSEYEEVGVTKHVEGSEGDFEVGDTVILDLNDTTQPAEDVAALTQWMEGHLGTPLSQTPVQAEYVSPDETTTFKVFDKEFGTPTNPWYFSQWQNVGEKPSFILWAKAMYEEQEESGYTRVEA